MLGKAIDRVVDPQGAMSGSFDDPSAGCYARESCSREAKRGTGRSSSEASAKA